MRLLIVSSWFPYPPDNGSKIRAFNLLDQLARRHEITLLSFAEEGEADPDDLKELHRLCREIRVVRGNPHKPRGPLRVSGLLSSMPRSYAQTYSEEMAAVARELAPGHDAALGLEIGGAIHLRAVDTRPRIFEMAELSVIHAGTQQGAALARWRQELSWQKYARFTRGLVRAFDRTTVVSDAERRMMGHAGCDLARVVVVPNGVSAAHLEYASRPEPDALVYPGAVTFAPNLDAVTWFAGEVLPRVRARRPAVRFRVTGRFEPAHAATLTSAGVTLEGHVADVRPVVGGSTLCVVPLRQGSGTRLKILEALALGTPVISTTKGAEGLDLEPGQDLLVSDDPEAFAREVVSVLSDEALRARLSERGRRAVAERYTWDRIGAMLEDVLERAVAHWRARGGA